jgi:uncharacterized protein YkwD
VVRARKRYLPLTLVLLPVLLALGCGVPLPAAELTATAESGVPVAEQRSGGDVTSASSGAPGSGQLVVGQPTVGSETGSALAPIEQVELAAESEFEDATPTPEPVEEATPEPEEAEEATAEAEATEEPTPEPTAAEEVELAEEEGAEEADLDPATFTSDVLTLLNQFRLEKGIPALQFDAQLSQAAADYAVYMATSGFFGHYPPDGSTPAGRVAAAGFEGQYKGEALSAGQKTPGTAVSRMLGSAVHAAILLSPTTTAAGVGYYYDPNSQYGHYWVIVTANP